ncbi:transcriptional activator MN1 [Myripristis murdjan]|uniref:transcriptional activator MN1 n=1 Tax=Myripristis murdjan TaxID=586833 RepID=UPI00117639FB|nr:transcriptional activator MN1-like [Myripristis murdjan]
MAAELSQDAVLRFLQSRGGSVRNAELLLHFRPFLRDHEDRARHRELFKKFVNSVAVVKQEEGVSYVVLKKKLKGKVAGGGGSEAAPAARLPGSKTDLSPPSVSSRAAGIPSAAAPLGEPSHTPNRPVLPSAGILNHNNNRNLENPLQASSPRTEHTDKQQQQSQQQQQQQSPLQQQPQQQQRQPPLQKHEPQPQQQRPQQQHQQYQHHKQPQHQYQQQPQLQDQQGLFPHGVVFGGGRSSEGAEAGLRLSGGKLGAPGNQHVPREETPPPHPHTGGEAWGASRQEVRGAAPPPHQLQATRRRARHRQSYKAAVSYDGDDDDEEEEEVPRRLDSTGGAWPLNPPVGLPKPLSSASSDATAPPSFASSPSAPSEARERTFSSPVPKIFILGSDGETARTCGPGWSSEAGAGPEQGAGPELWDLKSERRSLPPEAERYTPSPLTAEEAELQQRHDIHPSVDPRPRLEPRGSLRAGLSSSHSSFFSPSSSAPGGPGWDSSSEELRATSGEAGGGAKETKPQSLMRRGTAVPWHHSTGHLLDNQEPAPSVLPWHHSTGNLLDNREEAESSDGSASSPVVRQRPSVARRVSSRLRSRLCRSLGAELDRPFGGEAARLNRLHLLSSSLSLHHNLSSSSLSSCSTPPRCHSFSELTEHQEGGGARRSGGNKSLAASSAPSDGHRQVLVPLEPREHAWLVKGASGSWTDIYALFREDPSLLHRRDFISGNTVLHWIAKHGDHRVLNTLGYGVDKAGLTFDVNVRSACGYTPLHLAAIHGHKKMMRLLVQKFKADVGLRDTAGKKAWQHLRRPAPSDLLQLLGAPQSARGGGGGGGQQLHRLHYSPSSAAERRPGLTAVKRSSSIAAFLKHKSLRRFHGHQSDSSA